MKPSPFFQEFEVYDGIEVAASGEEFLNTLNCKAGAAEKLIHRAIFEFYRYRSQKFKTGYDHDSEKFEIQYPLTHTHESFFLTLRNVVSGGTRWLISCESASPYLNEFLHSLIEHIRGSMGESVVIISKNG